MALWPNGSRNIPRVTSEFNKNRRHPVTGRVQPHWGIDLVGWSQIKAPEAGVVTVAGYSGGFGNLVQIRGNSGTVHNLGHNRSIAVRVGQRISEGQYVAIMGTTGQSTGVHCHWETKPGGGTAINPRTWMSSHGASPAGGGGGYSQEVANQQSWLNQSRGEKLTVDGLMGPATTAAIKRYQSFLGVAADGQWGPNTQRAHQAYYDKVHAPSNGALAVDGQMGPATVRALQSVLGVSVDGQMGPNTIKALQRVLGVSQDGEIGPNTIRALQAVTGSAVDGQMGPNTIRALQTYLNNGGKFSSPSASSEKLTVDGQMGPATIKALQAALGVTVDGQMGPATIKALQKALGQTEDGQMGPNTIKALQTNVGATADGAMGPATIKALQTFLNDGKKFSSVVVVETPVITYPKPANPTYPGATWWDHSSNSTPRREGDKVQYFVVHHAADTNSVEQQRSRFMRPNDRSVSPNWLIGKDGSVSEIVPPDKFRAWTTGKFDFNAVTVETQNSSGSPTWGITEESHVAIAKLVAWASKRYGFPIDRKHVLGHREVPDVPATACPGPSMDLEKIVKLANEYATGSEPSTPTDPTEPTENVWKIEMSLPEATNLAKTVDDIISNLNRIRKLLP